MGADDVIKAVGLLDACNQLGPRTLHHLEEEVILQLVHQVDHLAGQQVHVVQQGGEFRDLRQRLRRRRQPLPHLGQNPFRTLGFP